MTPSAMASAAGLAHGYPSYRVLSRVFKPQAHAKYSASIPSMYDRLVELLNNNIRKFAEFSDGELAIFFLNVNTFSSSLVHPFRN